MPSTFKQYRYEWLYAELNQFGDTHQNKVIHPYAYDEMLPQ